MNRCTLPEGSYSRSDHVDTLNFSFNPYAPPLPSPPPWHSIASTLFDVYGWGNRTFHWPFEVMTSITYYYCYTPASMHQTGAWKPSLLGIPVAGVSMLEFKRHQANTRHSNYQTAALQWLSISTNVVQFAISWLQLNCYLNKTFTANSRCFTALLHSNTHTTIHQTIQKVCTCTHNTLLSISLIGVQFKFTNKLHCVL